MKIALMNTTIATTEGSYALTKTTPAEARSLLPHDAGPDDYVSAIGHQSTAEAMGALLGLAVPVNRIRFEQEEGQVAICLRVKGRIEEGQILDRPALEKIGYDLYRLEKLRRIRVVEAVERGPGLSGSVLDVALYPPTPDGAWAALAECKRLSRKGFEAGIKGDGVPWSPYPESNLEAKHRGRLGWVDADFCLRCGGSGLGSVGRCGGSGLGSVGNVDASKCRACEGAGR